MYVKLCTRSIKPLEGSCLWLRRTRTLCKLNGGDSGVEGRRNCAGGHGRRRRELTTAREHRTGCTEEAGERVLFCVKAQRESPPKRAKDSSSRESFHAAEVSNGGERSWISAAVSRSMTFMGPPHLGQRHKSCESLADERSCSAGGPCAAPNN